MVCFSVRFGIKILLPSKVSFCENFMGLKPGKC
jgi:hypothetical protein